MTPPYRYNYYSDDAISNGSIFISHAVLLVKGKEPLSDCFLVLSLSEAETMHAVRSPLDTHRSQQPSEHPRENYETPQDPKRMPKAINSPPLNYKLMALQIEKLPSPESKNKKSELKPRSAGSSHIKHLIEHPPPCHTLTPN